MSNRRTRLGVQFAPDALLLEDRTTPAVTVIADGAFLKITGDDAANVIKVVDQGKDGLAVVADGSAAKSYKGVREIAILSGGGNDKVSVSLRDGAEGKRGLKVNLGAGDDQFYFQLIPSVAVAEIKGETKSAPVSPPTTGGDKSGGVVVQPGQTGTAKTTTTTGGTTSDSKLTSPTEGTSKSTTPILSSLTVSVSGGDGNDVITAIESLPEGVDAKAAKPFYKGDFKFSAEGGAGDDRVYNQLNGGVVFGKFGVNLSGGIGNDVVGIAFHGVSVYGPLAIAANGGAGNDVVKIVFDPPPPPSTTTATKATPTAATTTAKTGDSKPTTPTTTEKASLPPGSSLNGPVEIVAVGGEGEDTIEVAIGAPPPVATSDAKSAPQPARTPTLINGSLVFTVEGGAGNDKLGVGVCAVVSGKGKVEGKVLAGAGDDGIKVAMPTGKVAATVFVDGGDGKDTGFVVANAKVVNVETLTPKPAEGKSTPPPPATGGDSKTTPPTAGGDSKTTPPKPSDNKGTPPTTGGDSKGTPPTTPKQPTITTPVGTSSGTGSTNTTTGGTFVGASKK